MNKIVLIVALGLAVVYGSAIKRNDDYDDSDAIYMDFDDAKRDDDVSYNDYTEDEHWGGNDDERKREDITYKDFTDDNHWGGNAKRNADYDESDAIYMDSDDEYERGINKRQAAASAAASSASVSYEDYTGDEFWGGNDYPRQAEKRNSDYDESDAIYMDSDDEYERGINKRQAAASAAASSASISYEDYTGDEFWGGNDYPRQAE